MNFKPRRELEPEINVTSLIDVILLLVMFFMVSTTFVQDGRLRVRLPQSNASPESRSLDPVVITVTAEGNYQVNGRTLVNTAAETLRSALEQVSPQAQGKPVTVRADARATHQSVVTAMDVAGRLGFAQVNIATVNEQPGR
jgi:biopolymer transport protein ExbD